MVLIKDLFDGEHVLLQVVVVSANRQVNQMGSTYYNLEVKDSSGSINAKKWEYVASDDKIFTQNNIIEIDVDVVKFKDSLQLKISKARQLIEEEIDIARFVKYPPIPKEVIVDRFNKIVDSITDKDCKALLNYFIDKFKDKIYDAPAAVSVHHEYGSGLLMHSVSMAEIADYLANYYNDINRDLLVTGALLHDFGKMIELEGKAVYKYSIEGKLLGHISIMCAEIREAKDKLNITSEVPLLLEHMVLSHHGQLEFGSPVLPLTREALLLSLIDNIDSKMTVLDKAYEGINPGEFTQKIYPLDGRCFYKAKQDK